MKNALLVMCCFITALSAEQKISLDDIEKDTLTSEKQTKLAKATGTQTKLPASSPAQYGFVPLKTAADYAQQQPTAQYFYNPQSYISSRKPQATIHQQQLLTQKYLQAIQPQKYVSQQYVLPQTTQTQTHAQQYVTAPQQQYVTAPQQYVFQPQVQQQKYVVPTVTSVPTVPTVPTQAYRQSIQYVTDNSIAQPQQKQYYTPQYVYLQQYPQATNTIQAVVDPKGGLQYIMYVPAIVPAAAVTATPTQAYENVVYVNPSQYATTQTYQQSPTQTYQQSPTQTYHQSPTQTYQQPPTQYTPQYVPQTQTQSGFISRPHSSGISSGSRKPQPKSLLDSYIPSSLQLQYLKQQQQQAHANVVSQPVKQTTSSSAIGKTDPVKTTYKSPQAHGSESAVTYDYQLPYYSTYQSQ